MALPNSILARILESLYADFLESDECIDISKHHCSLLHPCNSISKSTSFNPIYTFRLISLNWNNVFLSTAKLNRYGSHRIVQGSRQPRTHSIYDLLRQSVVFKRYRLFEKLQFGTSLIVFFVSSFFQLTITRTRCTSMWSLWFWGHWWMRKIERGDYQSLDALGWRVSNGKHSVWYSIGEADEGMPFSHWKSYGFQSKNIRFGAWKIRSFIGGSLLWDVAFTIWWKNDFGSRHSDGSRSSPC